jgi:hypothetical protein
MNDPLIIIDFDQFYHKIEYTHYQFFGKSLFDFKLLRNIGAAHATSMRIMVF